MSKQPLYINLYETLKQQIIEGQYHADDKFPSKRALGAHLSVSNTTIEHAYQILLDEGFIYAKPRSGYYVSDIESLPVVYKHNAQQSNDDNNQEIHATTNHHEYAFNMAEIDAEYFPMQQFRRHARDIFEDDQRALLQHRDIQGLKELRQEIAHYLFSSRGVTSHPNQIIIGSSTEQLINLLTDILDDQSFIIEQPSYPPIKHVLDKKQIPYLQVPVTPTGIDIDAFKQSNHHIAYVTPSHQFPTGYVMNLKKRTQLIHWAQKDDDRYIIEDDYDSEFRFSGKPIPALQSLDTKDKVIYISTFSKSLYPSCRIAYVVLPNKLLTRYHQLPYKEGNTVPMHLQQLVANFMHSGSFERHLNKMRTVYSDKLKFILERLKPYDQQLQIEGALTGMHFTLTITNGSTLEECLKQASEHQVKVVPMNHYNPNETQPKFIIGFGGIPKSALQSHTDALIKAFIK